ncbi:hypothetical protein K3174_03180 [Qipengyuania sp. 6D47A]|uniref:Uncharacterized protein n=2 Tax=Qipengyuania qiaonensis TaxID=2867240 RepID=A0ABS7J2M3_9SPHN|nr:hypothetical protein [Qipengyuania qiaonensis]
MALALAALTVPTAALAHHGWSWTEDEESRLSGTIVTVHYGNPHAHLTVRNSQGVWEVDLAPPSATSRAGFVEGVAKPGDSASFTGHRARDPKTFGFKAETITVNGKTYDVYPRRAKTLKPAG